MNKIRMFIKCFLQWFFKHREVIETHLEIIHDMKENATKKESVPVTNQVEPSTETKAMAPEEQNGDDESCQY